MQADLSAPPAAVDRPPPHSTTANRSHAVSYAFPGPLPPAPTSQSYYSGQQPPPEADSSPRAGDFLLARQGPGKFSFAPHPSPRQPAFDSPQARHDHYYVDEEQRRRPTESQPRSMALVASPGLAPSSSSDRVSSPALAASAPAYSQPGYHQQQQYELATQGRRAAVSGPMQRVVSTIQFSGGEYTPHRPQIGSLAAVEQPHVYQAPTQSPSSSRGFTASRSAYTFGTATGTPTPTPSGAAQVSFPPGGSGPVLDWAKPRSSGMTAPAAAGQRPPVPSPSFAPAPGPSRAPLPPPPPHPSSAMRHLNGHAVYYSSSYDPAALMLRTQSNESGASSYSASTESSSYASTGGPSSSHERQRMIHPALSRASGADSGYYSSPFMSRSSEFARSTSSSDLGGGVSGLRIAGALHASQGSSGGGYDPLRASTTRGGPSGSTGPKRPKRPLASDIFHPPPQAMLAPGAYSPSGSAIGARHGSPYAPSYAAVLPTDAEFAALPTKRSRGRRPPVRSDLTLDPEYDDEYPIAYEPSEAQIAWAGLTKTGKVRKIFLCKVPGCGKCFKRGEHLKRHVRSIHTNERPFQCQWPTCLRLFSRHDNLNQHVRPSSPPLSPPFQTLRALETDSRSPRSRSPAAAHPPRARHVRRRLFDRARALLRQPPRRGRARALVVQLEGRVGGGAQEARPEGGRRRERRPRRARTSPPRPRQRRR